MKYLVVENKGECEPESFLLMGASTKRGQADQIGIFGTGFKFAIACLMRERIQVLVVSGNIRYTFGTQMVTMRNQEFEQITVRKGRHTPVATQFTTSMGPDWEIPGALREVISNAFDEPNPEVFVSGEVMDRPGYTRIYVQYTDAVRSAYQDFDKHFTFRRKPLVEGNEGSWAIYAPWGPGTRVYRRGVLVYEDNDLPACFDYRNDELPVREDRKSDRYECERLVAWIMKQLDLEQLGKISEFLAAADGRTFEGENNYLDWYSDDFSEHIRTLLDGRVLISRSEFEQFSAELSNHSPIILPDKWVKAFGKIKGVRNLRSIVSATKLKGFTVIDQADLPDNELRTLTQALVFVGQVGIEIDERKLSVFEAAEGAPLGNALMDTKEILINRLVLGISVRETVKVLFEEFVHLDSENGDYTRGFQNSLINHWVACLEKFLPITEQATAKEAGVAA